MPTAFNTSVESEAPMKNMVMINPLRANPEMAWPISGIPSSKYVLIRMATINQRMNQGMLIFFPSLLKMNEVASAKGIIHRARVSLMVVAT